MNRSHHQPAGRAARPAAPRDPAILPGKLAERLAVQVTKSGEAHELQPMPAADHRIIHMTLKEHPDVMSESVGEGAARRLIIKPRHG